MSALIATPFSQVAPSLKAISNTNPDSTSAAEAALDGKVDDSQVLTNVPDGTLLYGDTIIPGGEEIQPLKPDLMNYENYFRWKSSIRN